VQRRRPSTEAVAAEHDDPHVYLRWALRAAILAIW
jgi:hypothetical protein